MWTNNPQPAAPPEPPPYDPLRDDDLKRRFAAAWLREENTFKAALDVLPNVPAASVWALRISDFWPSDPVVLAEKQRLVDAEGEESFLPTRAALARDVYNMAKDSNAPVEKRAAAFRLYAEIRGFIEKPGTTINNNVTPQQTVMLVKDHGSDSEWEEKAKAQQQALVSNA